MEKTFKTLKAAETYLSKERFTWNEKTHEFVSWDGRKASLTDWGDEILIEIWQVD